MPDPTPPEPATVRREGVKVGIPFAVAGALLGISFGAAARPVLGPVATIVMSAIVFAGAAQFAAVGVLALGGSVPAAVVAGTLLNLRFVPMALAVAPWMRGTRASRALQAQALVDASWAVAHRGGGRFDPDILLGATFPQYPGWVGGTVIGALAGHALGDPKALGLDAVFPAFFLALLHGQLAEEGAVRVAALGAAIALVLIPFTPPGVPIIAASGAALLALRRRAR